MALNFLFVVKTLAALGIILTQIRLGSTNCAPPCVIYAASTTVNVYNLGKSTNEAIVNNAILAVALDIDYSTSRVYWCDLGERYIFRIFLNGTGRETIVQNAGKCEGLAVEWTSRLLYWTNAYHKRIEVSHLDGTNRTVLISTALEKPRAVAVDPGSRFMFWTEWGTEWGTAKIERATLSGESRLVLINTGILYPNGLVVDYSSPKRLYWTDVLENSIASVNLDGSDKKTILKNNPKYLRHPFGVTILYSKLYYSDWLTGSIHVVNKKSGTSYETIKTPASGNIKEIMDIVMYDKSRQPEVTNGCTVNNGGCSNLCLLSPNDIRCLCPDGIHLNADGKTCSKLKDFLIFADRGLQAIYTIPTDTTTHIAQRVISPTRHSIQEPVAVEYDAIEDRVYWTDIGLRTISTALLDGNGFMILHNVNKPQGLAIDKNTRLIYWTDSNRRVIEVSRLDGSLRKVLVSLPLYNTPMAIYVDSINRFIYWNEWGNYSSIQRSTLDGSAEVILIDKDMRSPSGITVDPSNHILYWTDTRYGHIGSYNVITKTIKILSKVEIGWARLQQLMTYPFGVAIHGDSLYWTDWTTNALYVAKINSATDPKRLVALLGKPTGILASSGQINTDISPRITCPTDYDIYTDNKYDKNMFKIKFPTLFEGNFSKRISPLITCSPTKISRSNYGDHTVVCVATSQSGNTDTCSYRIWVKNHHCQRLSVPTNGNIGCKTYCTVSCDKNFVLAESRTKEMDCFGRKWKPREDKKNVAYPVCLKTKPPTAIEIRSSIGYKRNCKNLDKEEMAKKFYTKLNEFITTDQDAKRTIVLITIKSVEPRCSEKQSFFKFNFTRMNFVLYLNVSEHFIDSERLSDPKETVGEIKYNLIKRTNNGKFTLVVEGQEIKPTKGSYNGNEAVTCKKREIPTDTYSCITCSFGMFFNQTLRHCELCPYGTFQDKEKQTSCKNCPSKKSTVMTGTETSLGCYGGDDVLSLFELKHPFKEIDLQIVKGITALLINQYCKEKNCLEEGEQGDVVIESSDVIIPGNYPENSQDSFKIGLFVVVSMKHKMPKFFPRDKLSHIILARIGNFDQAFIDVITTTSKPHKIRGRNQAGTIAPSVLVPLFFIICLFCWLCVRRNGRGERRIQNLCRRGNNGNHGIGNDGADNFGHL